MSQRNKNRAFVYVESLEDRVVLSTTANPQINESQNTDPIFNENTAETRVAEDFQSNTNEDASSHRHGTDRILSILQRFRNLQRNDHDFSNLARLIQQQQNQQPNRNLLDRFFGDSQFISELKDGAGQQPASNDHSHNDATTSSNVGNQQAAGVSITLPEVVRRHLNRHELRQFETAVENYEKAQTDLATKLANAEKAETDCEELCEKADRLKKAWEKAKANADKANQEAKDAQKKVDQLKNDIDQAQRDADRHQQDWKNLASSGLIREWTAKYGRNSHQVQQARNALQQQLDLYKQAKERVKDLQKQLNKAQKQANKAAANAKSATNAANAAKKAYDKAQAECDRCRDAAKQARDCADQAAVKLQQATDDLHDAHVQATNQALNNATRDLERKQQELEAARQAATNQAAIYAKALNVLGVIGQLNNKNVSDSERSLLVQWLSEMTTVAAGEAAPPGFGEALGALQAGYGLVQIFQSELTPWHGAYRGDEYMTEWLIRKGHAKDKTEAEAIIKAMWKLKNNPVKTVQEAKQQSETKNQQLENEVEQLQSDVNELQNLVK